MFLDRLDDRFSIGARERPSTAAEIAVLARFSPRSLPDDYLELLQEASEVEILVNGIDYVRFWGADGAVEMNTAYEIQRHLPGALAIGDDEGGKAFILMDGLSGAGLYRVPFGALATEEAVYISGSITGLLVHGEGIDRIFDQE